MVTEASNCAWCLDASCHKDGLSSCHCCLSCTRTTFRCASRSAVRSSSSVRASDKEGYSTGKRSEPGYRVKVFKMCSRDCYRVFGYLLGFLWMISAVYYTSETVELLRLMKLRCGTSLGTHGAGTSSRLHFDDELTQKACNFYTHLDVFVPYHVVTTLIKMTPGFFLVVGIYKNNATLVVVFAVYALLQECFFVIVFSKIFAVIAVGEKSIWIYWIIVVFCVRLVISIWIILGVYAAMRPIRPTGSVRPRVRV